MVGNYQPAAALRALADLSSGFVIMFIRFNKGEDEA